MPETGGPVINQGLREAPRVPGRVASGQPITKTVREVIPEMNYETYQAYCAQLLSANSDRNVSNSALISMLSNWEPRFDGRYLGPTLRTIRNIDIRRTERFDKEKPELKIAADSGDKLKDFKIDWINHHAQDLIDTYKITKDQDIKMDIGGIFEAQLSQFKDFDPRVRPTIEFFIQNFDVFKDYMDPVLIRSFFRSGILAGNRDEFDPESSDVEQLSRDVLELAIRVIDDPDSSKPLRDGAYQGLAVGQRDLEDDMLGQTIDNFMSRKLKLAGLDPRKILRVWDYNYFLENTDRYPEFIADNFAQIRALESERPGICKVLSEEFGIINFNRYPRNVLIDQFDRRNDQVPYGVLVYPYADENGGFSDDEEVVDGLYGDLLVGKTALRIYEAGSGLGVFKRLSMANKRYGSNNSISFAVLGGHGEVDKINFGYSIEDDGFVSHDLSKSNLQGPSSQEVKSWFIEKPTIILVSCSTGADSGIGETIYRLGANVIAPKEPASPAKITAGKRTNGTLWFGVAYKEEGVYRHFRQKLS